MTKQKAKAKAKAPQGLGDRLDVFAASGPEKALQLVLWKGRHQNPEMTILITAEDVAAFDQCVAYLRVKPAIMIYRPEGREAQDAIPASGNRRAVPARPAEPPRSYVIVGLVAAGTRDGIKPVENNEQDFQKGEIARQVQVTKRNIPDYVMALRRAAASGEFSTATLEEAARALELWGRT